jgi:glycosyltransferase involved in cell wall biosynthesis/CelD/BcsL family acetyltransferase involved in cellulose biosynthesis
MSLTVLNVAYPLAPVGPDAVGGAEQILSAVESAVVGGGHHSLVLACEGSSCRGRLYPVPRPGGVITAAERATMADRYRAALADIVADAEVDVVHCHGVDFHHYLPEAPVPVLATLHLPTQWYPPEALVPTRPRTFLNCVSRAQRRASPPSPALLGEIENGVDLGLLRPDDTREDYALVMGRICPEKGMHLALAAAHQADVPLLIAGEVFAYPEHARYFEREIVPRLDQHRRFIGPVGRAQKARLLARARCLLVPSLVDETSSLVSMEALACGTPVVAFPKGALPDLVSHGVTGFLVNDVDEMARAIGATRPAQAQACRQVALAHFSQDTMCARYLSLYRRLVELHPRPPARRPPQVIAEPLDQAALFALADQWRALWARDSTATVFQRPEWLLPWTRHLLTGEISALALRRAGRLLALAPFFRWIDKDGARVVSLMGAGVSDYLDVVVDDEVRPEAAAALADWLRTCADRCEWSELRPGSLLRQLGCPHSEEWPQELCPALQLEGGDAWSRVPARMRKAVAYARRHATRTLGMVLDHEADLDASFSHLESLHEARWRQRGGGMLGDARVRAFQREAAAALQGDLLLTTLRLGGAVAGVLYGFHDRKATRYYLSGFDPALGRYSPGTLLVAAALDQAAARGATTFDFLRGPEPYKYAFGAKDACRLVRRCLRPLGPS